MREQGRCAGCQETGPLKKIIAHVMLCPRWAALYREDPAAALMPAQEHARWASADRAAENRAGLESRISDTQARRAASVARFKTVDPLED